MACNIDLIHFCLRQEVVYDNSLYWRKRVAPTDWIGVEGGYTQTSGTVDLTLSPVYLTPQNPGLN